MNRLILILFFLIELINAQVIVASDSLVLDKFRYGEKQETIAAYDDVNKELTLALTDKSSIIILQYDSSYHQVNELLLEKPSKTFSHLIGYSKSNNTITFFFTRGKFGKIGLVEYNTTNYTVSAKEIELDAKYEDYVSSFSYRDKFYIVSGKYQSNILNLYIFDDPVNPTKYSRGFPPTLFNENYENVNLSTLLDLGGLRKDEAKILFIDENAPSSLEFTTSKEKMYSYKEQLIISLDYIKNKTSFIIFDLNNLNFSHKIIDNNLFSDGNRKNVKSSNYFYRGKLFQICAKKDEFKVKIIDFESESAIKEFHAYKDSPIMFKNTPFMKKGNLWNGDIDSDTLSIKQDGFFTKMHFSRPGIAINRSANELDLVIGGYLEYKQSNYTSRMLMIPNQFGVFTFSVSPITWGFKSTTVSRAVFFKTSLDAYSFDHVSKPQEVSEFQAVHNFLIKYKVRDCNEVIYYDNKNYFVGYFVPSEKRYIIVKI